MSKFKNFILVIYDFENPKRKEMLESNIVRYSAYGLETCPTTGKLHWQAFICLHKEMSVNKFKKLWEPCHIEVMRGRIEHNTEYSSKEGKLIEYGDKPKTNENIGKDESERWKIIRQQCKEGKFDEIEDKWFCNNPRSAYFIHEQENKRLKLSNLDDVCGLWYYGPSGVGKSHKARDEYPNIFDKKPDKWWCGYKKEDAVLIDDLDLTHRGMAYYLNRWADKYPINVETKGGSLNVRPKHVIVTSRFKPEQIFDVADVESIERRFKIIEVEPYKKKE